MSEVPPVAGGTSGEMPMHEPLSSECGTRETVKTRFRPWLSGKHPSTLQANTQHPGEAAGPVERWPHMNPLAVLRDSGNLDREDRVEGLVSLEVGSDPHPSFLPLAGFGVEGLGIRDYRGTSLIRNCLLLGP